MTETKVYIFVGQFKDLQSACRYSEPQWQPEPDEAVSDAEYETWEDRNPTHELRRNINNSLDSDFIETVKVSSDYLRKIGLNNRDVQAVESEARNSNYMVLVYDSALTCRLTKVNPVSSQSLIYCGCFSCKLGCTT